MRNTGYVEVAGVDDNAGDILAASYRALARQYRLAFAETGFCAALDGDRELARAAGIVPLQANPQGYRFALCPRGRSLEVMARSRLDGRDDLVILPPDAFDAMIDGVGDDASAVADEAANGLVRRHPGLSAVHGATWAQKLAMLACILSVVSGAFYSPILTAMLAGMLTLPLFALLVILRIAATIEAWAPPVEPALPLKDTDLPRYTVLVALHRETAVLDQLIGALGALDYPQARLDILLVIESHDEPLRAALATRRLPQQMRVIIAPPGQPMTKPRALNVGLQQARGDLLVIYDAEDRPDPRQLRLAANIFARSDSRVACLQGRLVIDNADDSLISRLFALEYAGLFEVVNPGLIRAGLPVLLGGTTNHFRVPALRAAGGWDAWNVTEDADLAVRLVRFGFRIGDLPSATLEEATARPKPWLRQRTRWMKGYIQTLVTHTRTPITALREAGIFNALTLLSLCGGTLLSALVYPFVFFGLKAWLLVFGIPDATNWGEAFIAGLALSVMVGGVFSMVIPPLIGAQHRGLRDLAPLAVLMPFYAIMVSVAAWAAVIDYLRAPSRWSKTEHGLAVTSRSVRGRPKDGVAARGPLPPAGARR